MPNDLEQFAEHLCAALFSGGRIEHVRAHRITTPFVVDAHTHEALLQFDWIVDCRGSVTIGSTQTSLDGGCALMLVAPRRRHAMRLEPAGNASRVHHTRIELPPERVRSLRRATGVWPTRAAHPSIEAALNDVWRLTVGGGAGDRSLLRRAKLAEAIALWPGLDVGSTSVAAASRGRRASTIDRELDAALALMEQSLLAPPTLDDLADAAHLSVRHLTRRFRDAFGVAPMTFLDRKRLALAQQMLAYESAGVGEVAERMHFSSTAVFSRWFTHLAGETPTAYRSRPHML